MVYIDLRAVIDTNVLFEGLTSKGSVPGLLIAAWQAGIFTACVTNALMYEYEDVLTRKLAPERWLRIAPVLTNLLTQADYVSPRFSWRPNSPDPGDEHLVDCAIAAQARIVTYNLADFREAERSFGVRVSTPEQFATILMDEPLDQFIYRFLTGFGL